MSAREEQRWNPVKVREQINEDLSEIEDLMARLPAEAAHRADDGEMPGGAAMVLLGPSADPETWGFIQLSALFGRLKLDPDTYAEIVSYDLEPPLSFLGSWVDVMREARGQEPSTQRARLDREIRYLRSAVDWMLSTDDNGEPWWLPVEDFATRLHQQRRALEALLRSDEQRDTGAPCLSIGCEGRLLVKVWSDKDDDFEEDRWHCPHCKRWYDEDSYRRAVAGASKAHADRLSASDIEEVYRVRQGTVRQWANRGSVRKRGRDESGRQLYDVADVLGARDKAASGV